MLETSLSGTSCYLSLSASLEPLLNLRKDRSSQGCLWDLDGTGACDASPVLSSYKKQEGSLFRG